MGKNYWAVGTSMPGGSWLFEGIFSSEQKAVEAIKDTAASPYCDDTLSAEDMFVMYPVEIDSMSQGYDIYYADVLYRPLKETMEEGLEKLMEYKKSVDEAY